VVRFCPNCDARFESDVRTCPADGSQTFVVNADDDLIGTRVDGRYTITELIGAGGMGTVYRARQHSIDRDVALKLLRRDSLQDEQAVRRFFREARAASRLTNPHSITIFDFGQSESGQFYIAMEFLKGRSLAKTLTDSPEPFDAVRAVRIADQILEALDEAHAEGVLHRDIKPENVYLLDTPPEFVKVLDFGLAKMAERNETHRLTESGLTYGTPAFMSPEQAWGKEVDARSDVYSVGLILFEMLAGRLPHEEDSSIALILKKVQQPAPFVRQVNPRAKIPAPLESALARLLAIDAKNRPSSAAEARVLLASTVGLAAPDRAATSVRTTSPVRVVTGSSAAVRPAHLPDAPAGMEKDRLLAMLKEAMSLAGEGWRLYDGATSTCTSLAARELFGALLGEEGAVAVLIRRAAAELERANPAWAVADVIGRDADLGARFEEDANAQSAAIREDRRLVEALDSTLAFERRVTTFWERQVLAAPDRPWRKFMDRRLLEARGHVATLAEIKLRVLGLVRGAGADSLYAMLAGKLPLKRVAGGDVLFREGDPGDAMVVVVRGRFRLEVLGPRERPTALGEVGPGDVIGEMTCLDPAPRSATVTATMDSEVYVVDRGTLAALRESSPATYVAVIRAAIAAVTERIRETDERIERTFQQIREGLKALPGRGQTPISGRVILGDARFDPRKPLRSGSFSTNDITLLASAARVRMFPPGAWVCREGDQGKACYVLLRGSLEIVKDVSGGEIVLAVLSEGSVVGQVALVDRGARSASIRASGDVEVLELDRDTFEKLVDRHVPLALRFQEQIAVTGIRQLRLADRWLAALLSHKADSDETASRARAEEPRRPSPPSQPTERASARASPDATPTAPRPPVPPPPQAAAPVRRTDSEAMRHVSAYLRTALREWGMSIEDLDEVRVIVPDGTISQAELRARKTRID
jgi:CRP-like cAMP-binding protein/tRNA A-37 threonylcarbamoyl transferase component Bud32